MTKMMSASCYGCQLTYWQQLKSDPIPEEWLDKHVREHEVRNAMKFMEFFMQLVIMELQARQCYGDFDTTIGENRAMEVGFAVGLGYLKIDYDRLERTEC